VLFEPGDPRALADGIARLMDDDVLRTGLGHRGQAAVRESFTDEIMAERTWAMYKRELDKRLTTERFSDAQR